jgi:hypothetical protein
MIWLGAFVQAQTLRFTSHPLAGLCVPFLGPFGGAQIPQNSMKKYFLVVLDYFTYNNGPNDLVRGLFSSLDIVTYTPATCGPLCTFSGPFGGAQMPQNSIKNYHLVSLKYFS